jgi:predicted LPLAT superfamily acyltransferase
LNRSTEKVSWATRQERGSAVALQVIVWIALKLGRTAARLLLWPISAYFWATAPAARRASAKYLRKIEVASGRQTNSLSTFKHIHTFASVLLDRVFMLADSIDQAPRFDTRMERFDQMKAVHESRQGGVFVGAHVGSFEALRVLGMRHPTEQAVFPNLIVRMAMYEENARKIKAMLDAINPEASQYVVALGSVSAMLELDAIVARGEFIGMLADRHLGAKNTEGSVSSISFLGENALFPTGPFRLAMVLKKPVFMMFGLYQGANRYDICFEPLEVPALSPVADGGRPNRQQQLDAWQRAYVQRLEHFCKIAPYNWFNFYDFWQH